MHVPLVIVGPGVDAGVQDAPVSTRRIFQTILDWAGLDAADSLRHVQSEVVLGEERSGRVIVERGLADGERIVDAPPDTLEDGDRVRVGE